MYREVHTWGRSWRPRRSKRGEFYKQRYRHIEDFPKQGDWLVHKPSGNTIKVAYSYPTSGVVGIGKGKLFGAGVDVYKDIRGSFFFYMTDDFDVMQVEEKDEPVFEFIFKVEPDSLQRRQ